MLPDYLSKADVKTTISTKVKAINQYTQKRYL